MRRTLPLLLALMLPPAGAADPDTREALVLTPEGRAAVLAEMRGMLQSVKGIVAALADGDNAASAAAARSSGRAAAGTVPMSVRQKLPEGFRRLGMATHQGFDTIATAAEQGETTEMLLMRLGEVMDNCVSCHASYQIRTE